MSSCAYQGEPGAYSEQCATDIFAAAGRKVDLIGLNSFDEVFASLAEGKVEYAAVPVENTLGGSIHVNYDLLLRYHGQVHILGEHVHRVRHTMMALPRRRWHRRTTTCATLGSRLWPRTTRRARPNSCARGACATPPPSPAPVRRRCTAWSCSTRASRTTVTTSPASCCWAARGRCCRRTAC